MLSGEEADGTVEEVEDDEHSTEQESSQSQRMESYQLVQQGCAVLAQQDSAVLAQQESALLISAMCQIEDPSKKNQTCKKQVDALQQRLAKYERGSNSAASMVLRHQPFSAQGLSYSMSWAKSPPPYGHFFPSPFGFYPQFMLAPPPFETPRTTMLSVAELDDEQLPVTAHDEMLSYKYDKCSR